jgi:hypothetical protein
MAICHRLLSAIAEVKVEDLVPLDPTEPSDGSFAAAATSS